MLNCFFIESSNPVIINNEERTDANIVNKGISANSTTQSGSALSDTDKKIRTLTKKLRQIADLKERQKNGDVLEQTQVSIFIYIYAYISIYILTKIFPYKRMIVAKN